METPASREQVESRSSNSLTIGLGIAVLVVAIVFAFSGSSWFAFANDWYALFKAIHVAVAVFWVGGGLLLTILGIQAQRSSDPVQIVTVARQAAFVGEKLFAPAGLVVLLMGIAMMIDHSWGWGHFWVVVGLLGYASTFAVGVGVLSPLAKQITRSAEENGPTHPQTIALIERIMLIARIDIAVLLVVVLDMATKPFA